MDKETHALPRGPHRHRVGLARREFLQVGLSGFLGVSAARIARARAALPAPDPAALDPLVKRAKSVIILFQTGGPSHHDTFDMKPDAPEAIRGDFKPIPTNVPGVRFCEHLPGLAARADKLAVVRSITHPHNNHLNATHWALTGQTQPDAFFDKIASRDDHPHYAAALHALRPPDDGLPAGVLLPTYLMEGPLVWPGQHAGFLGPRHDPWILKGNPADENYKVEGLALPDGYSLERLADRKRLFEQIHALADSPTAADPEDPLAAPRELAHSLLATGALARAFNLREEPDEVRDRYGRHIFGQSTLLARRLVQVGIPVVQVNLGAVQNWDSHGDIFRRLKEDLLPPTDRALSALLDDLQSTGLLDETLVVLMGEFGRTPKVHAHAGSTIPGRDHWPAVFSAVFAGAGVQGGQTIGRSDPVGAYPASQAFTPADIAATIYTALGLPPGTHLRDRLNRPVPLATGKPLQQLYTAQSV